jgi:hypothetical protein
MSRATAAITVHGKDELLAHAAQEDGDVDEVEDALLELDLQGYDPTALPTNSSLRDLHIYEYHVVMTLFRVTWHTNAMQCYEGIAWRHRC